MQKLTYAQRAAQFANASTNANANANRNEGAWNLVTKKPLQKYTEVPYRERRLIVTPKSELTISL